MEAGIALQQLLVARGRSVPMPASNAEIVSLLLHLDESTRARALVVEFPPGFIRLKAGRYEVGEEFYVLSGELELNGQRIKAGDWCWVPLNALRTSFASPRGAVVYAWFSGRNDFVPAPNEPAPTPSTIRSRPIADVGGGLELRTGSGDSGPSRSAVIAAGAEIFGPCQVLDLATTVWSRLGRDEVTHAGSAGTLVRWDTT